MSEVDENPEAKPPDSGRSPLEATASDGSTSDGSTDRPGASDASAGRRPRLIAAGVAAAAVLVVAGLAVGRSEPAPESVVAAPPPARPGTTSSSVATTSTEASTTTTIGTTTTTRAPRNPHTGPPGPLTGAPVERPGYERRPALVVKIDNYDPDARPQHGLTNADVVYEEKVEGPYSRFAAVFQGTDAEVIGPVRSARSTDVAIVGPLNTPLFAYSGANGGFQNLLGISPLIDVGAGRNGSYYRGGDKVIPHNLYSSTAGLYGGRTGGSPAPLFEFRPPNAAPGPGARSAVSASYHFGGGITAITWTWDTDEGGWVRTQNGSTHLDSGNWPVTVDNVIVEYVPYVESESQDASGNPIPEAAMHGEGRGWVLTGGAAIPVNWSKFELRARTDYYGLDGQLVRLAPGRTWVALVPVELSARISFADGSVGS